ncbi:MAG: hypothetical protein JJ899_05300 [Alphaproteobacteria bacterium]|nr:hypothetical protein [Alphaproteobacteria bacterium]
MPKALVFIDHDMIVRHFVLSGAFRDLERAFDVTYVFNDDRTTDKKWLTVDVESLGLGRVLYTHIPRARMGSWYPFYAISVLRQQRGTPNYKGRRERMVDISGWKRTLFYDLLSRDPFFRLARRRYADRLGLYEPLIDLIRAEQPDLLIQPTQLNGYYINELLLTSETLDIPFLILMNSWDNPSQKAAATGMPTRMAVWGTQTRDHAMTYMGLPAERLEIIGAAQFDLYRKSVTDSDEALRKMFAVPPDLPVVLYGGVSKSINETRHLRLLDDAIADGRIAPCHILYRPHPWRGELVEGEEDFFDIEFRHVSMDPHMEAYYRRVVDTGDDKFDMADYEITRKLLHMIAGTVSSLSTIQLETTLNGKPSISFMPGADMRSKYGHSAAISARLAHFNGLWDCPGVEKCESDDDLPAAVNRLLDQAADPARRAEIREYANAFALLEGPSYPERLRDLACEMVDARADRAAA